MTFTKIDINDFTQEEKDKIQHSCEKYGLNLTLVDLANIYNKSNASLERQAKKNALKAQNRLLSLLTQKEREKLTSNWNANQSLISQGKDEKDFPPVVKFFNPTGVGTWYLSELSPDNIGFGICHLFEYELGHVSLDELNTLKLLLPIEKDRHFSVNKRSLMQCYALLKDGCYL
jgi:hypothetical protein